MCAELIEPESSLPGEIKDVDDSIRRIETRIRVFLQNTPDYIAFVDRDLCVKQINRTLSGEPVAEVIGKSILELYPADQVEIVKAKIEKVFENGRIEQIDCPVWLADEMHFFRNRFAVSGVGDQTDEVIVIIADITKYKKIEDSLALARRKAVITSRKAGMADISTDTLHNIGNILNSITVGSHILSEGLKKTPLIGYRKANALLRSNLDCLEDFILKNPKGKKLIDYYLKFQDALFEKNDELRAGITRISEKVDEIAVVISAQQNYVGTFSYSASENLSLADIIHDILTIQKSSLKKYQIDVIEDIQPVPDLPVHKIKLADVLTNLIVNAKDAMADMDPGKRKLTITLTRDDECAYIKIADTGIGIAKDELGKVFAHGFTKKQHGHGFGLHSCAGHIKEMGGEIWAESEGPNMGATFIVKFKLKGDS